MDFIRRTRLLLVGFIFCLVLHYPSGFCDQVSEEKSEVTPALIGGPQLSQDQLFEPATDSERLKRAQGPITELYTCILTIFLNPYCWNRFENNRLRYLQYLYLRRRLKMMEEAMRMNQTASAPAGTSELPRGSDAEKDENDTEAQVTGSRLAKMLMRKFPKFFERLKETQKRAQGLQKQIMEQAQRLIKRLRQQSEPTAEARLQNSLPIMMMRT